MAVTPDLIASIAREMHGRTAIDAETTRETAKRLSSLLAKARLADEDGLKAVAPAFSFDPGAIAYRTKPAAGSAVWADIARQGGGTGYGGTQGTTGVSHAASVTPPAVPAGGPAFLWWPATTLAAAIRRRELSPVEVVKATLDRIRVVDQSLNAFVTLMARQALAEARRAESEPSAGPLHGVPVALKDLFETAGVRTTAGSRILADYVPAKDATVVSRLRRAGAIVIGKTATHEFAFGPTTDSPFHGPVHNPWDLAKIPGGSSGGSGAAVAAGLVGIAMGTDTGGSIRMPSAHCGVVGLKPTYGRVSKAGVLPLSWSLDHPGPLARTVADAALALSVTAGPDPADPSALPVPVDDYLSGAAVPESLHGVRIGVPEEWLEEQVDPDVLEQFRQGLRRLEGLGAEILSVKLPPAEVMTFVNRLITLAEAGAYHASFVKERAEDYAPDVRQRMELGQYISARDYLLGERLRTELARQVHGVMKQVDALATPTIPIPPAEIGQPLWEYPNGQREPVAEAMVRFTAPFSVTGQPAFSLPCGFTQTGLPVGFQLVGKVFREADLIRIAVAFEAASGPAPRPLM